MRFSDVFLLMGKAFSPARVEQLNSAIDDYTFYLNKILKEMEPEQARDLLISEYNFKTRGELKSCRVFNMTIEEGDICYIDFGKTYLYEAGYQHFGLVIKMFNSKAFVIPMTSNPEAYRNAYDPADNPQGMTHLMRFGKQKGCYRYSVLFLNDAKYINTARIINKKGHIETDSELFKMIKDRLFVNLL